MVKKTRLVRVDEETFNNLLKKRQKIILDVNQLIKVQRLPISNVNVPLGRIVRDLSKQELFIDVNKMIKTNTRRKFVYE